MASSHAEKLALIADKLRATERAAAAPSNRHEPDLRSEERSRFGGGASSGSASVAWRRPDGDPSMKDSTRAPVQPRRSAAFDQLVSAVGSRGEGAARDRRSHWSSDQPNRSHREAGYRVERSAEESAKGRSIQTTGGKRRRDEHDSRDDGRDGRRPRGQEADASVAATAGELLTVKVEEIPEPSRPAAAVEAAAAAVGAAQTADSSAEDAPMAADAVLAAESHVAEEGEESEPHPAASASTRKNDEQHAADSQASASASSQQQQTSASKSASSTTDALAQRSKRMFGAMLGHLTRAKKDNNSESTKLVMKKQAAQQEAAALREAQNVAKEREAAAAAEHAAREARTIQRAKLLTEEAIIAAERTVAVAQKTATALDRAATKFLLTSTKPALWWSPSQTLRRDRSDISSQLTQRTRDAAQRKKRHEALLRETREAAVAAERVTIQRERGAIITNRSSRSRPPQPSAAEAAGLSTGGSVAMRGTPGDGGENSATAAVAAGATAGGTATCGTASAAATEVVGDHALVIGMPIFGMEPAQSPPGDSVAAAAAAAITADGASAAAAPIGETPLDYS